MQGGNNDQEADEGTTYTTRGPVGRGQGDVRRNDTEVKVKAL